MSNCAFGTRFNDPTHCGNSDDFYKLEHVGFVFSVTSVMNGQFIIRYYDNYV